MNLEKAIKVLKNQYCMTTNHVLDDNNKELKEAITTVLSELENRYYKGYQNGFKQAKFDCEMDKLDGR